MTDSQGKSETTRCRRCDGVGSVAAVDELPGIPPKPCHRCEGSGREPLWARSPEAWEIAFRAAAQRAETPIDMQDFILERMMPNVRRLCSGR